MIIIGIDPGWDRCGWARIESDRGKTRLLSCGLITTSRNLNKAQRLKELYRSLLKILQTRPKPNLLALEEAHLPPKGARISNLLGLGEARGVIMLASAQNEINIQAIHPLWVKSTITGNARASKQQVASFLKVILGEDGFRGQDDISDAVAIAYTAAACQRAEMSAVC